MHANAGLCNASYSIDGYEAELKDFKAWWCNFAAAGLPMPCANRQSSFFITAKQLCQFFKHVSEKR